MTRVLLAILLAAGVALTSGACGLLAPAPTVVMVSGRDDHGDLQRAVVGLQRSPTDPTIAATARDGEFAHILRTDGPNAYLRLLASGEEGWIDDHYLRGEAVRAGTPPRRVRFIAAERDAGGVRVRVRYGDDSTEEWVPATSLREVGAR